MRKVPVAVCMTMVLLVGFMAPAFAGDPKAGGYSPEMQTKIEET